MPTYYYIITTDKASDLVDSKNYTELETYILSDNSEFEVSDSNYCVAPWVNIQNSKNENIYHILSYAVDTLNFDVLEHFKNHINLDFRPDGNAYNLFHLALEKYTKSPTEINYNIVKLLVNSQLQNHQCLKISSYMRHLLSHCDKTDDYKLVSELVLKYGVDIDDFYHYSIAWNYKKVFDYILENFSNIVDFNMTKSSVDIARRFDHDQMAVYVIEKINKLQISKDIQLQNNTNLFDPNIINEFAINNDNYKLNLIMNKLIIPENVTHVKTSYDFNQNIDHIVWPPNLQSIKFGAHFDRSLSNVIFPNSVKHISFGIEYNWGRFKQSLQNFKFPEELEEFINQGEGCSESLANVVFPNSLKKIKLGWKFNYSLDDVVWPTNLEFINFSCDFSQSLANVKFPPNLKCIEFYQLTSSIPLNTIKHPIKELRLCCIYTDVDINLLPTSLECIRCYSDEDKIKLAGFDKCVIKGYYE